VKDREQSFRRTISGEARGIGPSCARTALATAEPGYRAVVALRNALFDRGWKAVHRVPRPVVSVGNLTTGGTGKTPVVAWLADLLRRRLDGEIAILTRGYKSREGASDEAILLDRLLNDGDAPDVHVIINPDRVAAVRGAIAAHLNLKAFVMDDGFQHRRLHRDIDLVLIDATNPFGHGHLLPRGLLREPVAALRRADVVLITRVDQSAAGVVEEVERSLRRVNIRAPVFRCSHAITSFRDADGHAVSNEVLQQKRVVAFAGIGNPESFRALLMRAGCNVVATRWFGDHHAYSAADIAEIAKLAGEHGAMAITTAKDAVKIPIDFEMLVADLRLAFANDDEQKLADFITGAVVKAAKV